MKCDKCGKKIKENTEGNQKYCQGHSILDPISYIKKGYIMTLAGEIRNECWNCGNYFDITNPANYASRKTCNEGGKMYIKCNHCGKFGNHL